MNKLDIEVKNLGRFKGGAIKVRPLTVLTGKNGTGKSFFTKTLYPVFSIVNKNLLYIETADNIRMSSFEVDVFDGFLTRKGRVDKNHIQLLKSTLDKLHSIFLEIKDRPIDDYFQTCSVTTNTEVENFNKFIEYLVKLEKKQKINSVRYPADFLKKCLDSLIFNLTKRKKRYEDILENFVKKYTESIVIIHKHISQRLISTCYYVVVKNNTDIVALDSFFQLKK